MKFYVSSLLMGMSKMEELAEWINNEAMEDVGVELIAFTHNEAYWERLLKVLDNISCPVTFHGPYIGVEATYPEGTEEYNWMIESYDRVFALAKKHKVNHIVFHYTQKFYSEEDRKAVQEISYKNIKTLMKMAEDYGVNMLIENLPIPKGKIPLYTNEEYSELFERLPEAKSIIDIGHANMNGLNLDDFLKNHGSKVKAYHFHNNNGEKDLHNSFLEGTFDYKEFVVKYKENTPNADIVLEYEPHVKITFEELKEQLKLLKKMFA
ncbi:sugar phosphate isomerase/epimerase family protein [Clostridium polynesiense]|uniref:sugar phosphate isomerase/epimerase family protein n=1 Tax=Clostridium polynesiense TaxID=1325933 RepID=UPI00058CBC10|nr:sugar phosphate isomerase/epimerase [Clostridium polynesiense]